MKKLIETMLRAYGTYANDRQLTTLLDDQRDFLYLEVCATVVKVAEELAAHFPPIPMVLFCPHCQTQHIDAPDTAPCKDGCRLAVDYGFVPADGHACSRSCGYMAEGSPRWTNPPHRSHLCAKCGCIWRPADVPTTGVAAIQTRGKADNWQAEEVK